MDDSIITHNFLTSATIMIMELNPVIIQSLTNKITLYTNLRLWQDLSAELSKIPTLSKQDGGRLFLHKCPWISYVSLCPQINCRTHENNAIPLTNVTFITNPHWIFENYPINPDIFARYDPGYSNPCTLCTTNIHTVQMYAKQYWIY
jgi:hypothetical protein